MIDSHKIHQHSHLNANSKVLIFCHTWDVCHIQDTLFLGVPTKARYVEFDFQQIKRLQLDAKIVGSEYYVRGTVSSVSTQLYVTASYRATL